MELEEDGFERGCPLLVLLNPFVEGPERNSKGSSYIRAASSLLGNQQDRHSLEFSIMISMTSYFPTTIFLSIELKNPS